MAWNFFPFKNKQKAETKAQPSETKPKPRKKKKAGPEVKVLNFEFNPNNPKLGSLELDWNKEFVDLLSLHGYKGLTDEDIVNNWLTDVCKTIALSEIENLPDNIRYIQRKDIGDGKTEVS